MVCAVKKLPFPKAVVRRLDRQMRKRQAPWNKYEAVILLQGVLDVQSGKLSRMDAIKEVSARLRKMALNSGIEIDDTYRNVNGISFQMCSMESAYYGRTIAVWW